MLELHVWGPSFTLPSISPQCLSTIAYLNLTLTADSWSLIPSSNPLLSPTLELPALRDETMWVAGFRGIVDYLRKKHGNGLDDELTVQQKAECTAFSAFVEVRGQPLIDLSLYLTPQNFDAVTRRAYSAILPFPVRYFTPTHLRSLARARQDALGSGTLDLGSGDDSNVSASRASGVIKAAAIAREFLEPLQERLGDGSYFFGDKPSSLDCLVAGYLALCFYPDLPSPWLRTEMTKGSPRLCGYLNNTQRKMFGSAVDAREILAGKGEGGGAAAVGELPWGDVERGDLPWITGFFKDRALEIVGFVKVKGEETKQELEKKRKVKRIRRWERFKNAMAILGCVGGFVGYCFWSGLVVLGDLEEKGEEGEGFVPEAVLSSAEDILGLNNGGVEAQFSDKAQETQ